MKNRTKAWLLEAPAILVLIAALIASIYLSATKQLGVGWGTAIVFLVVLILFFWGKLIENKFDF